MSDAQSPQDLAADYALGLLDPAEVAAFEQELAQSPGLQLFVRECREALALFPAALQSPAPGTGLRDRVLAHLRTPPPAPLPEPLDEPPPAEEPPVAPASAAAVEADDAVQLRDTRETPVARGPRPRSNAGLWMALAALVLVAAGLGVLWRSALKAGQAGAAQQTALHATADSLTRLLAARDATIGAILTPGIEIHPLKSTGAPEPGAEFFWNRKLHTALLYAYNLKPNAAGRAYQLWLIQGEKTLPSATFPVGADGHTLVQNISIPADLAIETLAVTDEPAAGSPKPTTPILLLASLGF